MDHPMRIYAILKQKIQIYKAARKEAPFETKNYEAALQAFQEAFKSLNLCPSE
jgi:hypothetical protein